MRVYNHSSTFAELKAIKEDITVNLTSLQYLQMLDYFLWKGVVLLYQISPVLVRQFIVKMVAFQQHNPMMKFSTYNRNQLSCAVFNFLTTGNMKYIKKAGVNRDLFIGILSYWVKESRNFFDGISMFRKEKFEYELPFDIADTRKHYAYFREIEYWLNRALDFKSKIVQKYTRMTLLQAQKAYVKFNYKMSLDDISQIYLQTMSKAIDRCDSRLGVLTTFIQSWLKSAYAIVYKAVNTDNITYSYDSIVEEGKDLLALGTTNIDTSALYMDTMSKLLAKIDTTGVFRIKYNIPQYLDPSDISYLKEMFNEQQ